MKWLHVLTEVMLLVPVTTIGIGLEFLFVCIDERLRCIKGSRSLVYTGPGPSDDVFLNAKRDLHRRV